jgi:hypothetical protein
MLRLVLALGVLSTAALPVAAAAQAYPSQDPDAGYQQGYSGWGDNSYRGDADRGYDDQDNDRSDDSDAQAPAADAYGRDSGYRGADPGYAPGGDRFTGRVGAAWRDDAGRRCQWREVSHRDADGYDAYKWVTLCRD